MAMIEIPVDPNLESQRFEISLDGTLYTLRFYWNIRQESWTIDIIEQANEVVLIQGIKIEPDWMPLFRYQIENFPPGDFIVIDTSGTGTPPDRTEFGLNARVKLLYQEAS
jgi:hypothetical protein